MLYCWVKYTETGIIEPYAAAGLIFLGEGAVFVGEDEYLAYCESQGIEPLEPLILK